MTLFRFVLMASDGTVFIVRAKDATLFGERSQVLDKLNGDWSYYRDRSVFRYELSCFANAIIVHVA